MFLFLYFISTDGTASILFRKLSIQAQHVQDFHVGNDELSGDLQTAVHVAASFSIHGDGRSTGDRTTITSDDIEIMLQYATEPPYMDSSRGTIPHIVC